MSTHWRAGSVMTPAKSNAPVFRSAIAQKNGWSTIISNGNGLGWAKASSTTKTPVAAAASAPLRRP